MVMKRIGIAVLLLTLLCAACGSLAEAGAVEQVSFERGYADWQEYATICGLDAAGETRWSLTTGEYESTELDRVCDVGIFGDRYYYVEDGEVVALDLQTGAEVWRNAEFGGASVKAAFGEDGTLYLCGYYGPDLFAVRPDGTTQMRVEMFDLDWCWAYAISVEGDGVCVTLVNLTNNQDVELWVDPENALFVEQTEDAPDGRFTGEQLARLRAELQIPDGLLARLEQSEPYSWETGERNLVDVNFYQEAELIAHAAVDAETAEPVKEISPYSGE